MSMLRNVPVIYADRQIGLFQGICLDRTRKRVYAFLISSGLRGKRMVPVQHVCLVSERFILIDGWSRYRRLDELQVSLFVRDDAGLLVGRITDYAIDKATMEVFAIEVLKGYFPKECRKKDWMYTYSFSEEADAWIIPAVFCCQSCISKEGNET